MVDELRIRRLNDAPLRVDGDYVLYWMVAARRSRWNMALERAAEHAREQGCPLVVLEALGCRNRWASDRMHRFVLDGMRDNLDAFARTPLTYHPYVEPTPGAARGLLEALAARACVVVTDDWPCVFIPRLQAAAAERLDVCLEAVDGNGVLPMRAAPRVFPTAHGFRGFLQRNLKPHLAAQARPDPLAGQGLAQAPPLPGPIVERWPAATRDELESAAFLASLDIDHGVPAAPVPGGAVEAGRRLEVFLGGRLARYADRNDPDDGVTSELSAHLHFGHISSQEIVSRILDEEGVRVDDLPEGGAGKRAGWWGASPAAEGFLDQVVTWRELGFNMCWQREDHDRYDSLPPWAQETLEIHAGDRREHVYPYEVFDEAATHDEIWNAAQRQLREQGCIHNYLRMVWGKKILEWSPSPQVALEVMIELNNRYALDGRDPNSYSGIFWILGRYDRAWGPERPVYGKIRYMSTANTRRKLRLKGYLARWSGEALV